MNFDSLREMQFALAQVEQFIRAAVARAQAEDHNPNDALRGLVITDDEIDRHLTREPLSGFWGDAMPALPAWPRGSPESPFAQLTANFELTPLDSVILLLALAPEFDRRYERLYAYLQDDVSQRRPTVNLMMNLLGRGLDGRFAVWERFAPESPLRRCHLVTIRPDASQSQAAFLAHQILVDHRIAAYLLADSAPDERLKGAVQELKPGPERFYVPDSAAQPIMQALADSPLIYLQGPDGVGRRQAAAALCAYYGIRLVAADAAQLNALAIPFTAAWQLALREARLARAAFLITNWESALAADGQPPADLWDALAAYPLPVFLCGKLPWEPGDPERARRMLRLTFDMPPYPENIRFWTQAAAQYGLKSKSLDLDHLARRFRFTPAQIARAVGTAVDLAASRASGVTTADLVSGAQAHSRLRLGQLARQIVPRHGWDDLVLPPDRLQQLHELRERAEYAHTVREQWGFGRKISPRQGISALFAGESGTGKTMAAEVIAGDLGLIMYKIDLSAVVSKYIGETEKNLSVIFQEARASNAILFFDEADALFGKRAEVKDAHDRYANIETAYLLQEIEEYDGIAILATNLRQNMDEAFTRRLDFVIDFPFPEPEYRKRIWQAHFPPEAPLGPEIDLDELAERFPLAGGNIRNAALTSAYLAAADGKKITMQHIRHAIRREHQKMGRLVDYGT